MSAGPHALSRLAAMLVLAGVVLAGCGDGAPEHRSAVTPTAARGTTPSRPRPARGDAAWTREKVIRRLAGRRIRVQGRIVRVDPDTVTCGGLGSAAGSAGGKETWSRFRCVQPTFPAGAVVGPDAIFFAEPRDAQRVQLTGKHFTRY